jgi:transcriptional regulator with XRE-family HTH domain
VTPRGVKALTIATKLKELRTRNKVSLQQLADGVKASKAHIWDIERGESRNPSMELLKRIADYFKVSIADLVEENPNASGEPEELIALYRGLKELSKEDRETITMLMQRLRTTRPK